MDTRIRWVHSFKLLYKGTLLKDTLVQLDVIIMSLIMSNFNIFLKKPFPKTLLNEVTWSLLGKSHVIIPSQRAKSPARPRTWSRDLIKSAHHCVYLAYTNDYLTKSKWVKIWLCYSKPLYEVCMKLCGIWIRVLYCGSISFYSLCFCKFNILVQHFDAHVCYLFKQNFIQISNSQRVPTVFDSRAA